MLSEVISPHREETKLPGFIFPLPFEALGGRHNKAISGNIPI